MAIHELVMPAVRRAARRAAKGRDWIDVDDLCQEGWIKILSYIEGHPGATVNEPLAYSLAFYAARSYLRGVFVRARLAGQDADENRDVASASGDPSPLVEHRMDLETAYAKAGMTDLQRRVFELQCKWGLTSIEAGLVEGINSPNARKLAAHARRKLRGGLGASYGDWSRKQDRRNTPDRANMLNRRSRSRLAPHLVVDQLAAKKPEPFTAAQLVARINALSSND